MFYIKFLFIGIWNFFCVVIGIIILCLGLRNYNLMSNFAKVLSWGVLKIARVKVICEGQEHIDTHAPCVYVCNHQSALDLVTLGAYAPKRAVTIAKQELFNIPIFGWFLKASGNIPIDRSNREKSHASIAKAAETVHAKKVSVAIAPEGTRHVGETMLPFKKGPFHLAIAAQVPIVGMVCAPIRQILDVEKKTFSGGNYKVRFLAPVFTEGMGVENVDDLLQTVRSKMEQAFADLAIKGQK